MTWVVIISALALAGLVTLLIFAVSLAHKAADVKTEVSRLNQRRAELRSLVGHLKGTPEQRD